MRSWSIPVGHLFGVDLRLHVAFLFLLIFVFTQAPITPNDVARDLALVGIMLVSVLLHELAHALAAAQADLGARTVVLLPIGGVTLLEEPAPAPALESVRWGRELRVALAGPAANLLVALVAGGVLFGVAPELQLWRRPLVHPGALARSLVWVNLFLAAVNLLPAYPLDAGRLLRARLLRGKGYLGATRFAVSVGQIFSMLLIFAGFWDTWLMLVGFFLFLAAQLEERSVMFQSVLENVRMEEIMLTDFATLSPADTLGGALHKAVHSLQDDFPVVRGSDMVGVISRRSILRALRADGNAYVQSAMEKSYEVAERSESLASGFRKLSARGLTLIPVVEDQRLVGIVTLQNLMHSMALLAESRRLKRSEAT